MLSDKVLALLEDQRNELFLSLASIWEIQIKLQIGKLSLNVPLSATIEPHLQTNQLQLLPVATKHIYNLSQLPLHHKDPFDRMLIAQALSEDYTLLSKDSMFSAYSVKLIW